MTSRESPEYKRVMAKVRKRDGHQCQHPGCKKKKKLQVHHLIRYADSEYLQLNEKNLITLCSSHHYRIRNNESAWIELYRDIIKEKYK